LMFGNDRVYRRGENLIVRSATENPYWEVREYRKIAVLIGDDVWCVSSKETVGKHSVRYTLDPWPEHLHQIAGRKFRYDAEYVRKRDEAEKQKRRRNLIAFMLLHFRLLIGFLPSCIKIYIDEEFGISARSASLASIVLEFFIFIAVGVLTFIFSIVGFYSVQFFKINLVVVLIMSMMVLSMDLVIRYGSYLRENSMPPGFCEWAFIPLLWCYKGLRSFFRSTETNG